MPKKRATGKPRTRRKTKSPDLTLQLLKIAGGLSLLILLVVGAGLLAYHHLQRPVTLEPQPAPPTASARKPQARVKPTPEEKSAVKPSARPPAGSEARSAGKPPAPEAPVPQPTYEVFPAPSEIPAKPMIELEPLPGDQPPLVAIVIDDIGYDRQIADQFLQMDVPLTLSLLPSGPFSREIMVRARSRGNEIMLHLPMEPNEFPQANPGPGALLSEMSPDELIAQLNANLALLPGLKGVNNHMGSRLSSSPERMRQIFTVLKKRGLYYIDSRTTAETVARKSARLLQVPFAERDIFIDHVDDPEFISGQMEKLIKVARRQGYAVGIAHPHPNTCRIMRDFLPRLKSEVQLVPASMVVQAVMLAEARKKE